MRLRSGNQFAANSEYRIKHNEGGGGGGAVSSYKKRGEKKEKEIKQNTLNYEEKKVVSGEFRVENQIQRRGKKQFRVMKKGG